MTHEQRVEVGDGIELRVLVRGPQDAAAAPFVLVHGLASNALLWNDVAAALAELGHQSAAVDLRGHGPLARSHRIELPAGMAFEAVTADLGRVIGALGWDRPVTVGQSWGGNVVVELAARLAGDAGLRGIACVDGGTIELANYFPDFELCAAQMQPPELTGTRRADMESYLASAHPDWPASGIDAQLANFETRSDGTIVPWLTRDRHMAVLRHLYEHRPSQRWTDLGATPVLLIPAEGGHSPFDKRAEVAVAVAALERSRVRWVAGDHDLHAQHPRRIASILHDACIDGFFA